MAAGYYMHEPSAEKGSGGRTKAERLEQQLHAGHELIGGIANERESKHAGF